MSRKSRLLSGREHIPETANWVPVKGGQVFEMSFYSNSCLLGHVEFYGEDGQLIPSENTLSSSQQVTVPAGSVQARLTYTPR